MQNQNNFLSAVELFNGLSEIELTVVAQHIEEMEYAAGDFLFKKGDPRKSIFIINEGIVLLTGQDV